MRRSVDSSWPRLSQKSSLRRIRCVRLSTKRPWEGSRGELGQREDAFQRHGDGDNAGHLIKWYKGRPNSWALRLATYTAGTSILLGDLDISWASQCYKLVLRRATS